MADLHPGCFEKYRSAFFGALMAIVLISLPSVNGQSFKTPSSKPVTTLEALKPSNLAPLSPLFDESVLSDNAFVVLQNTSQLPASQRFDELAGWVLPSAKHDNFRLSSEFNSGAERPIQDSSTTNLVSPVLELITAAKALGRMAELRERVSSVECQSELQQRSRLALLTLIDLAMEEYSSASESLEELYERHRQQTFSDISGRWPETLVAAEAIHHAQVRDSTEELLRRIRQDQVWPGKNNGPDPWDRLIPSLLGQLERYHQHPDAQNKFGDAPQMQNWVPVSTVDFGTHGLGFPISHWDWNGKSVRLMSHHNDDYLYFRSPLLGDYQVECDSTGFGYREAQLLTAGTWVVPAVSHDAYFAGQVGGSLPMGKISPKLSEITDWMRLQAIVESDQCKFLVDGRLMHTEKLTTHRDPWVAIRVPFSTYGQVRDLCITGTPQIPETVRLSDNERLHGWVSYYGGGLGDQRFNDWWHETDDAGTGTIVGINAPSKSGTGKESLLRYQRPVLEDGEIQYEFFYEPEKSIVHPAVAREVILLQPAGVMIHQITDAHFDRTGLDPLNQSRPKTVDDDIRPPQFKHDAWNLTQLKFLGDVLEIRVNGGLVYRGQIAARLNERFFGLFHYDGDSEFRVRDVQWRGEWPKTLPPLPAQELRDKTSDELDAALSRLTAEFSHDFAKDGLPLARFQIQDQGADKYVETNTDGLHINAEMRGTGYRRVCITPLLVVDGDFDMTAEFEKLNISPTQHGLCNAMLQMAFTDDPISHHAVSMTTNVDPGKFPQQMVNHDLLQLKPFHMGLLNKRSEAVTSGTLRLARRGDKVYSLFAPEDSAVFRLIHVEDCATQSSRFDGARLVAGMNSSVVGISKVSIIWKSLRIRANRLTGPAMTAETKAERKP